MGDWNNDGKVDSMDYHIYTNYIDKGGSGGRRTNSFEGKGKKKEKKDWEKNGPGPQKDDKKNKRADRKRAGAEQDQAQT